MGSGYSRVWTQGSITRNLLDLSWPIIISESSRALGPTIDMIWVGKLGAAPVAGVGIAGSISMAMIIGLIGFNTGLKAVVARFIGAADPKGANHVAQQGFVISAIFALIIATVGILFARQLLSLFGVAPDVVAEGSAYLRIIFIGSATLSFYQTAEGIMQASGDAITPMRISLFCRVLHLGLCPFLIFGWWIFPRWGVSGAAVSNVISQSLAMFLGLFVLFKGRTRLQLTLKNFGLDFKIIWRIVRIGIPAALSQTGRSIGRIGMTWFMVPFGTLAVASHVLVERIEIFITLPGFGFGQSAGVLVGQNLGASQPGRAVKSTWLAVAFAESIVVVFTTVMLLFPGRVLQVFSSDPVLVELASSYLTIAVIGYLTLGIATVFAFALSGAGDTVPPMTITLTVR